MNDSSMRKCTGVNGVRSVASLGKGDNRREFKHTSICTRNILQMLNEFLLLRFFSIPLDTLVLKSLTNVIPSDRVQR